MTDTTQTTVPPAASTDAPVAAPAVTVAAPVAEAPVTPQVETPAAAPVTEPVTAPAAETPVTPPAVENILGDVKPNAEVKPDATKPEIKDGEKPEVKTEAAPEVKVELPVYEPFKLPENIALEKQPMDAFTKILGEVETGKLDHAGYQAVGQKLIDLAVQNSQETVKRLNDYYEGVHETQKKEWFESFKKDPVMGGEKLQETVSLLRDVVDNYGGTPEQISEFRTVMKDTGVGNHPAVTRILYNMAQKINKYTTEGSDTRIVAGTKPAPSKVKPHQIFYNGGAA